MKRCDQPPRLFLLRPQSSMPLFVTGAAGFIGSHIARALLARGERVLGIDNFSDYYDPVLKFARLKPLRDDKAFTFLEADISDREAIWRWPTGISSTASSISPPSPAAAFAGRSVSLREHQRHGASGDARAGAATAGPEALVYASSSSVTAATASSPSPRRPGRPSDLALRRDQARRRADDRDLLHLSGSKATGLRYFTVYGPWGRPDMSPIFAKAIHDGGRSIFFTWAS